jgi:guanylate kinase
MASTKPTMSMRSMHQVLLLILASFALPSCQAFVPMSTRLSPASRSLFQPTRVFASGYVPPAPEVSLKTAKKNTLYPKVGDFVRFFDLDGGKVDGEVLVGKISFIQKNMGNEGSGWSVDITQLEDVGDGYYAEYPSRQRSSKRSIRDLAAISPVTASYVGSEYAFKVPREAGTGFPAVRAQQYDIEGYLGPFSDPMSISQSVVERDGANYEALKDKLLRAAAITGLVGTLIADLNKGTEDAIIYAAGASASILYLLLLSIKTDTMASEKSKMGSGIANLRFAMPLLVVAGITLFNKSLGDANPAQGGGTFYSITAEQFGAATLGFLTYRVPLFLTQIQAAMKDAEGDVVLPGSAGIAMKLAKDEAKAAETSIAVESLATIFLVSGPQATGRTELVKRLIDEGKGRFIEPNKVDRVAESAKFERFEQRDEFLTIDKSGRYGTTKQGILTAAKDCGPESVVVIDADVALAKQLSAISGTRLVGVWVGLRSVKEFEERLGAQFDRGEVVIPEDESRESVSRARIKEIIQEIEYGISSGIFEFTILNDDEEESMRQLRGAAAYCFN